MFGFNFGRSFGRCISLLAIFVVLILACPLAALGDGTAVSIGDVSAEQGDEVVVPIEIAGVTDLGAVEVWLNYDGSVVEVTGVADGDLGTITYGIDNPSGVTRMVWFSATGKTGDFVFASVTLRAVGSAGDTSYLDIAVKTLINIRGDSIQHSVDNGLFTVKAGGVGQYGLTISSAEGGSVTTPGEGTFTYDAGEVVQIVASPDDGYEFDEWTGDVNTVANVNAATTTITMDADKSVIAVFSEVGAPGVALPGGLSTGAIIGIVVGVVVIAVVVLLVVRKRRRYD